MDDLILASGQVHKQFIGNSITTGPFVFVCSILRLDVHLRIVFLLDVFRGMCVYYVSGHVRGLLLPQHLHCQIVAIQHQMGSYSSIEL